MYKIYRVTSLAEIETSFEHALTKYSHDSDTTILSKEISPTLTAIDPAPIPLAGQLNITTSITDTPR